VYIVKWLLELGLASNLYYNSHLPNKWAHHNIDIKANCSNHVRTMFGHMTFSCLDLMMSDDPSPNQREFAIAVPRLFLANDDFSPRDHEFIELR
jgi:hypothetical protein